MMTADEFSYLERDESEGIKGLMILLILLGHNISWVRLTNDVMGMVWLYCFHIKAFFLLPFLYPQQKLTWKRFGDYAVRFYVPFICFLIPLCIITFLRRAEGVEWHYFPLVFVCGGSFLIREFVGNQLLWFLPAMFAATVIRSVYASISVTMRWWLYILASGMIIGSLYNLINFKLNFIFTYWILGLQYLFWGRVLRYFFPYYQKYKNTVFSVFVFCSFCFVLNYIYLIKPNYSGYYFGKIHFLLTVCLSMSYMGVLYHLRSILKKISFIRFLGKNSFVIYLSHIYFGYITYWLLEKINTPLIVSAVCCMTTMISGSCLCIFLLGKIPVLYHLLLPKNMHEFANFLSMRSGK